jgi:Sulfotransferase domain
MTAEPVSDAAATNAPPKSGIVWLASYPRSGNTWTRSFIHNLVKIMAGEEDEQDINAMGRFSIWDIAKPFYTDVLGYAPSDAQRREIAGARHQVQARIADAFEGLVFVKTHHALVTDRGSTTINPAVTAGAVYIVRNPLDVAISFAHHAGQSIDDTIAAMAQDGFETVVGEHAVYEIYGSWSQHVLSWTRKPHQAIYVMRYEEMLAEPARIFGGLARHLQLGASPAQIEQAIERAAFGRLRAQEDEKGFRERPPMAQRFFREGRAGQWKDILTARQIERIVRDHREQMTRFGYLPPG